MKKIILCVVLIMSLCLMGGCQSKGEKLKADKVTVNTISVLKNGKVQVGAVEDFDKDYYNEEGLNKFINESIDKYNNSNEDKSVKMESFTLQNKQASLVLSFDSIETYIDFTYADFENMEGAHLTTAEAAKRDLESTEFVDASTGESVSKEDALDNEKNKVIIINEETQVIVQGKIKYYSNAVLLNKNEVQTGKEGMSIIVYKP